MSVSQARHIVGVLFMFLGNMLLKIWSLFGSDKMVFIAKIFRRRRGALPRLRAPGRRKLPETTHGMERQRKVGETLFSETAGSGIRVRDGPGFRIEGALRGARAEVRRGRAVEADRSLSAAQSFFPGPLFRPWGFLPVWTFR